MLGSKLLKQYLICGREAFRDGTSLDKLRLADSHGGRETAGTTAAIAVAVAALAVVACR